MREALALALSGAISPEIALSRMLLAGAKAADIKAALDATHTAPPTAAWQALAALLEGRAATLDDLAAEIAANGSDHTAIGTVSDIAAFFDHAVTHSPAASVALYSLGDPAILQAATQEVVAWIAREGLLPAMAAILDVGCGIGRIAAALAPHCRTVLGLDVSAGMIAEAERQHGALANLRFAVADGGSVPPGPYDLVLLVDSMPYIFQVGLADRIIAAVAAQLSPGGAVTILNLSYNRPPAADLADAGRWAASHGWSLSVSNPFTLWDGTAFVLRS